MLPGPDETVVSDRGVVILNWRDRSHPEGGGSEVYVEQVAAALVSSGHDVTIFCAAHDGAPGDEMTEDGVRIVRRGSRLSVYARAAWHHLRGRFGPHEVVVEVQNGMPFLARLYARRPVVVLVHHVHREQWRVVFGPLRARLGWWIESRVAPWVNRGATYVTVSDVSRDELATLGVRPADISVVHNGNLRESADPAPRSEHPSLVVLGRLVPHKRVEIALEAVARLRAEWPALELVIAGRGWWEAELRTVADRLGVADSVRFAGYVTDDEKHRLLARSWVSLVPSLKEGWGLAVVEAAAHGTPSVAFHGAGGVTESIVPDATGLLAAQDDVADFIAQVRRLLVDSELRFQLGRGAASYAAGFSWQETAERFEAVLVRVAGSPSGGRAAEDQRVP